MLELYTD